MSTDEPSLSGELSILKEPPSGHAFARALESKLMEAEMSGASSTSSGNVVTFPFKKAALLLSAAAVLIGGGTFAYMASQTEEGPVEEVLPQAPEEPVTEAPKEEPEPEVKAEALHPTKPSATPQEYRKEAESKELEVDLAVPQLKERGTNETGGLQPLGDSKHSIEGGRLDNKRRAVRRPGEAGE